MSEKIRRLRLEPFVFRPREDRFQRRRFEAMQSRVEKHERWMQRRVDFRDYLEKVVILQWTKKYTSKGHCFAPQEDVVELKTEDQTI